MALIDRGMYKLILRIDVAQEISQVGWRYILSETLPTPWGGKQLGTPNFDGEIVCISGMSPMDMSATSELLMSNGFRWSEDLVGADFAWFELEPPKLDWLERVEARPIKKGLSSVELWQLRGSKLPYFVGHDGQIWWRGSDYDW